MYKVYILVIRGQFSNSDGNLISVDKLRVEADPFPPRSAAKQHHLADRWRNCSRHSARPLRSDNKKTSKINAKTELLVPNKTKNRFMFSQQKKKPMGTNKEK